MIKDKKIAVVMPAYNASKTLAKTYHELPQDIVDDVILVDDCSSDDTSELARSLGIHVIRHKKNGGYGANQKTCYRTALERGADIVIMVHPDYQYSPKLVGAIAHMLASGHYDAIMASRMIGKNAFQDGMPWWKYLANRLLTKFQNTLMGARLSEYHTGYRGWNKNVLMSLPLELCSDDFVFDNQMIAMALNKGFKFGEVSCPTRYFEEASSINLKRSIIYGIGCLKTAAAFRANKLGLRNKMFS